MRTSLFAAWLMLIAACSADRTSHGGADLAVADLAMPADAALGGAADLATAQCHSGADCRLFTSTCSNDAPCQCLALGKHDPDPVCTGQMVSCLVDPCANLTAICQAGVCGKR